MAKHNGKNGKLRITLETSRKLMQAKLAMQVCESELGEAQAKFNNIIAKALAFVGAPIQSSLVCLDCGLVYPRPEGSNGAPCPECNAKPKKAAKPASQPEAQS